MLPLSPFRSKTALNYLLEYLLGAPGVGTPLAICAPPACARVNAAVRVMPVPEICAPAACAKVSGAATVIRGAASAAGGGGDNRRLMIRATINCDSLAGAKAYRAGDWDNGRAHVGGGARRGGACSANTSR